MNMYMYMCMYEYMYMCMYMYKHMICICTGCPGCNVPDFGRMFLKLKYTDITQNTYIQS